MTSFILLLLAADPPPAQSPPPAPAEFLARIPRLKSQIGEDFEYEGYVFKSGIRVHVGNCRFKVTERTGADSAVVINGVAEGGKFGYTVRMVWDTILDPQTLLPRISVSTKTGSNRRFERYLFLGDSISYMKLKHCNDPNCKNPAHVVKETTWFGPIPTGSETKHCEDCEDLDHYIWRLIHRHEVKTPFLDMLTALFAARTSDFALGSSFVVPVVQARDRWDVTVRAVKQERLKVTAGTFDCLQVVLEPVNVGDRKDVKGRFQGLFGIQGTIKVWIDRSTRLPVRILGEIPFGIFDLNCEVVLSKIHKRAAAVAKTEDPQSLSNAR